MDRQIHDCGDSIAIAYPRISRGAGGQGRVHLQPVHKVGGALSQGIVIEGERALGQLRGAIDAALTTTSTPASALKSQDVSLGRVQAALLDVLGSDSSLVEDIMGRLRNG